MSSTIVHSKTKDIEKACCSGGQSISDEKGKITIPPTAAKEGPSVGEFRNSIIMNIEVHDGELREDGKLMQAGSVIADFGVGAYKELKTKQKADREALRGEDR